jgi:hypothetical protein
VRALLGIHGLVVLTPVISYTRGRVRRARVVAAVGLALVAVSMLGMTGVLRPAQATAATANTINFQARLMSNTGAIAPDGDYNVEFKLYNAGSSSGSSQGSCSGDSNCLWTETRTGASKVTVANGYLTVNLGSVTALPSNIWNQQLWLTMNIGGTGSPSWDGEMNPRLSLTAVPAAYALTNSSGSNSSSLTLQTPTGSAGLQNFVVPDQGAPGTYNLCIQSSSACGFALGSGTAFLQGGNTFSGTTAGDLGTNNNGNLNLRTNGTTKLTVDTSGNLQFAQASTLNVASAATGTQLTVKAGDATSGTNVGGNLVLQGGAGASTGASGSVIVKSNTNNSASAFQVQDSSGNALLTGDTTNMRLGVNMTYAAMSTPTGLSAGVATSGGSLAATTTYFYKVTAIDSNGGETVASTESSRATTGTNKTIPVTWTAVTGASGYKVYRSTTTGTEVYLTTVLTNSFTDAGTITAGSTTPPSSTTAYVSTNVSNSNLQLTVGGNGTPTGQVYVGGTVPSSALAAVNIAGNAGDIVVNGNYGYIANTTSGLQIYDISSHASPLLISTTAMSAAEAVAVEGRYAYVTRWTQDLLEIVDISNPFSPSVKSTIATDDQPFGVYIQGRYAYVVNKASNTLQTFDISNPSSPTLISSVATGSGPVNIAVQGRYAYVANTTAGNMQVFDISNPASPVNVSTVSGGGGEQAIAVQGRYAYVTYSGHLQIIDISNPAAAVSISTFVTSSSIPYAVSVQGRYAYVAHNNIPGALDIIDISNPTSPRNIGSVATINGVHTLYIQGRYAYVANTAAAQLQIFDLGGTYTQQLEAGGAEFGTLQVDSNEQIAGDSNIQGGLSVGQSIQAGGNLGVAGNTFLQGTLAIAGGIQGGASISALSSPGSPTITTNGTTGAQTWGYEVAAVSASGVVTPASVQGTTTSGNGVSTLTSSNYQQISWTPVAGAVSYKVYRTQVAGTSPNPATTGLIGTTSTTIFNDTGIAGSGSAPTAFVGNLLSVGTLTTADTSAAVTIATNNAANKALVIQGSVSQTANLFEFQKSNGTLLSRFDNNGQLTVTDGNGTVAFKAQGSSGTGANSNVVVFGTDSGGNREALYVQGAVAGNSLHVGGTGGSAPYSVAITTSASNIGLIVQGAASQTANLQNFQDVNGNLLSKFDANGQLVSYGTSTQLQGLADPAFTTSSTGTSYYYCITATNAQGSTECSAGLGMANNTSTLNWNQVTGATGYKLYRNTSNSFTSGSLLLTTITNGATVSYTDTGSATGAGLPVVNPTTVNLSVQSWANMGNNYAFQVTNSAGTPLVGITGGGRIGFGLASSNVGFAFDGNSMLCINSCGGGAIRTLLASGANGTETIMRARAGGSTQTGDLFQLQDSNANILAKFDGNGNEVSYGTNHTYNGLATPAFTTSSSGSSYYYVITATNSQGETVASASLGMANNTSALAWSQINGATGYKLYRNTSNSFTSGSLLLTTITNGTTTGYTDTGSATSVGLPPTAPTGTGLTIQGWGSQTADLLDIKNSLGSIVTKVDANGYLTATGLTVTGSGGGGTILASGIGDFASTGSWFSLNASGTNGGAIITKTRSAANVGFAVQASASQSGDLLQLQNSSGTAVSKFDASGNLGVNRGTSSLTDNLEVQGASSLYFGSTRELRFAADASNEYIQFNRNLIFSPVSSATVRANLNTTGYLGLGGSAASTQGLTVTLATNTDIGTVLKGAASQSGDLFELQDSSGNVNGAFNGTGNQLTLGRIAGSGTVTQGKLVLGDGTTDNFGLTLQSATITANRTYSFPNSTASTDTICLLTLANCGGGGTTYDGSDFIVNGTGTQSGNFNVQSSAAGSVAAVIQGNASQTADIFQIKAGNGASKFTVYAGGESQFDDDVFFTGIVDITTSVGGTAALTVNNNVSGTAVAITGAPLNNANISYLQLGNAISGGNAVSNGGTYFGLNAPNTGAGSAADFLNFQLNGSSKVKIDNTGSLTYLGSLTGGTSGQFTVSNTGAIVGVGVNSGTGLLQGTGGLTVTGVTSINGSGSATTTIGNASSTTQIGGPLQLSANVTFDSGSTRTISVATQTSSNTPGNNLTVVAATGNGTGGGGTLALNGGTGGTGATGNGGNVTLSGGNAASTNGNGGNATIDAGTKTGSGTNGTLSLGATNASAVILGNSASTVSILGVTTVQTGNSATALQVQNSTSQTILAVDTSANQLTLNGNINMTQVARPSAAPTSADAGAGSIGAGTYYYVYTYITAGGETAYSAVSSGTTIAASHNITVTVANSPSSLVTGKKIYRGTVATFTFQLVGTINDNTTTTFNDSNTSPTTLASTLNTAGGVINLNGSPVLLSDNLNGNFGAGYQVLSSNASGINNTAVGYQALKALTGIAQGNTALGYQALTNSTVGLNNTALGASALSTNTSGNRNIAIGTTALVSNTSGSSNIASGFQALNSNTTGSNNTATGESALKNLKTLTNNISATANNGGNAKFTTTSTTGMNGGMSITISGTTSYNGSKTVLTVDDATHFTISTAFSTADSSGTWTANNISSNTAEGYQAGQGSSNFYSATGNSLFGYQAGLVLQTTADFNTLMGYSAGSAVTTGAQNVLLGYNAGTNLTTGSSNIIIGAGVNAATATGSNQINIGNVITGFTTGGDLTVQSASGNNLVLTAQGAGNVNISSGSGSINLQSSVSVASGKNITYAGSGNFDQSASSGTFKTGTGAVSINGDTTVASGKSLTVTAGNVAYTKGSDYSTTGSADVNFGAGTLFRLTGASAQTITGIQGGTDGRLITLVNAAGQAATLCNSTSGCAAGTASDRITTGTGSDMTLAAGQSVSLVYDSGASLWRVTGSWGGGSSSLQAAYNTSAGATPSIQLSNTFGGITVRDAASSTIGDLFAIQNNGGTKNYFSVSATGFLVQNASGNALQLLSSGTPELRVYGSGGSNYAKISYDDGTNTAIFAASTGTTQIGSGSGTGGDINLLLTNLTDKLAATHTNATKGSLATTYNDFSFTRNVDDSGTNSYTLQGNVFKIEDLSAFGSSGSSSPNVLYVNQNNTSATGNLILVQTGGNTDKFKVDTAGLVTTFGGLTAGGGAVQLNAGTNTGATTIGNSSAGTITLQSGNTTTTVASAGTTIQSNTNSATAFQVQNASGASLFIVDTTSTDNAGGTVNLVKYAGFESGAFNNAAAGWDKSGSATLSQNTTKNHTYNGIYSAQVATTAASGDGLHTSSFSSTPATGTYIISFYAKVSTGTMVADKFTVTSTDGTSHTCSPANTTTINANGFQRVYCSLTTTGNMTDFKITQNDSTSRTIYIDAVQLETNSYDSGTITTPSPYRAGNISLRGVIINPMTIAPNGNSTEALKVVNTGNSAILTVDTLNNYVQIGSATAHTSNAVLLTLDQYNNATDPTGVNGAMYYNTNLNKFRCYENGAWVNCISAITSKFIVKGAVENVISSTVLQDDDDLQFTMAANETWVFEFRLLVTNNNNAGPDWKSAILAAGSASCNVTLSGSEPAGAVFPQISTTDCTTPASLVNNTIVADVDAYNVSIQGRVTAGASGGTVKLQWAQNTSTAVNLGVRGGSYVIAQKVGGN